MNNLEEIVIISVSIVSFLLFFVLPISVLVYNKLFTIINKKNKIYDYKKQIRELQSKLADERRINDKLKRQLK